MRSILVIASLFAALPAAATDHELSMSFGSYAADDPAWGLFSDTERVPSFGLRAGYAVHDRVAVIGTYQHTRRGADLYDPSSNPIGRTAFFGNELGLGAKVDYTFFEALSPYASVTGLLLLSHARYDDDPNVDDNPVQLQSRGTAGGARTMGGVELKFPREGLTAAIYAEAGYTWMSAVNLGDLGGMDLGGFTAGFGVGIRY